MKTQTVINGAFLAKRITRLEALNAELLTALKHALSIVDPLGINREFRADRKIAAKAESQK